jgi:hypothetical protein
MQQQHLQWQQQRLQGLNMHVLHLQLLRQLLLLLMMLLLVLHSKHQQQ